MRNSVKNKIQAVSDYLLEQYGEVKPEWKLTLDLLADNLELYEDCKNAVKIYGLYDKESGRKQPLLATMKDLQATILKQVQHFGISPYAAAKIKGNPDNEDGEDDPLKEFICA